MKFIFFGLFTKKSAIKFGNLAYCCYLCNHRGHWNNAASKLIGILFKFFMKCREQYSCRWRASSTCGVFATRGLQRLEYPQILYLSEFHHIPLVWLYHKRMLPHVCKVASFLYVVMMCIASSIWALCCSPESPLSTSTTSPERGRSCGCWTRRWGHSRTFPQGL